MPILAYCLLLGVFYDTWRADKNIGSIFVIIHPSPGRTDSPHPVKWTISRMRITRRRHRSQHQSPAERSRQICAKPFIPPPIIETRNRKYFRKHKTVYQLVYITIFSLMLKGDFIKRLPKCSYVFLIVKVRN